ncbi:MAG: ATP-binding protein, partial [Acidobacteriota bacterium]|nr:ATP-binding protein [Acidobacteriota bacterium]
EIRTPMAGILGMTEVVLQSALDDRQREGIETVKASAESLLAILNDVLDFSKIEARHLELEAITFSPADAMREALTPLAGTARQKGLSLVSAIGADVPAHLIGDPLRFRQVVMNLVGNAIKFTEHGSVRVEMRVEHRDDARTRLHVTVSDTGIGIEEDRQAVIFEAFRQADHSTARRFGGSGLGLAICASLVRLMRGRIWVESQPGRGSAFHVTIDFDLAPSPAQPAAQGPVSAAGAFAPAPEPRTVLLAEDNLVNQRVAKALLACRGHRVTVVANGLEAVEAVARERFDVVLMDLQMPVMDGLTATSTIRAREREHGGCARIIAMTAHAMASDQARAVAAGMDGFITKPATPAVLFDAVEGAAAPQRQARAPQPGTAAPHPDPAVRPGGGRTVPSGTALATT